MNSKSKSLENQDALNRKIHELKEQLREKEARISILEQTLDENKYIFDTILEGTLAGYWDWHIQEDYEYMSPTFKSMFGYKPEEFPNKPESWQKIIHPDDLQSVFTVFDEHVKSKGKIPYHNEVRYYHKDGSIIWIYCRGKVVKWNDKGEPIRMIGSHVDITSLKKVEHLYELLASRNKELEQFAYITSHDLQEPLRTVRSFAELLQLNYNACLNEEGKEFLEFITSSANRMSKLIKALLDHSRIGKNTSFELINFNEIIDDVKSDLRLLIEETNAKIVYDNDLPTLFASRVEIKMLFQNVIKNAIKFQKKGNPPVIRINTEKKGTHYEFTVSDNGIGINHESLEEIFVIFRRLHLQSDYSGTGIGLAHCKKIVELHAGKIWVESELGKGSTFHFTIQI